MGIVVRTWQVRIGSKWCRIQGLTAEVVVSTSGPVPWKEDGSDLPAEDLELRYSVPVRGQMMAWRPGDMVMLAEDFAMAEVAQAVREAQVRARRARTMQAVSPGCEER